MDGTLQAYHHTQLQMLLDDYDHVQKQADFLDKSITEIISENYAQAFECLDSISDMGIKSAEIIIREAGKDMSRFPTADHFTAWCGIAPGNNESAGKRKHTAIKKGNTYLRVAIDGAAWAAVRMKDSYWHALFDKLCKRMKAQKAIVAVARRLLKVCIKHWKHLLFIRKKVLLILCTYRQKQRCIMLQDYHGRKLIIYNELKGRKRYRIKSLKPKLYVMEMLTT